MSAPAPTCLALDGALTLRTTDESCTALRTALAGHGSIAVDCRQATQLDLSFVQLLLAARAAARRDGGDVVLAAPPDGALLRTLEAAGFRVAEGGAWFAPADGGCPPQGDVP
jgi:anti-anti-sigma regulatory factor